RADVPDHRSGSHRLRLRGVRAPSLDGRRPARGAALAALHGDLVPDRREVLVGAGEEAGAGDAAGGAARGIGGGGPGGRPGQTISGAPSTASTIPVHDLRSTLDCSVPVQSLGTPFLMVSP